ncbi:phospholipase D-like domain-containing protein [Pedobacter sp. MC2016-05]|uniref:phospholipase D-like domain-containing protein n=1 Tax=Pedobacter sp. MC2016-05 TaxID=2994474 RepID=UPI002246426B|nr:phospholipase D-like domain-containing protein [Pedobacter sp. MC2016-05]MCX2472714.1 phospholipase D-like domain-containing protein [Pedobacter sp. MC2016-05]
MNDILTNGSEIKQRIISEILNASQCIYLAMAWFTDRDIATAIIDAKNRNVTIDIILSSNASNETVKVMLRGSNISVHAFDTGDVRGMMHHKFCLIDNRISINGSYNYSYNASNNNVENIQVSDEPATYKQFFTEFERIKYNIDHNIDVNTNSKAPNNDHLNPQPLNLIDNFSKQLHDLVYSAAQINTLEYRNKGYETSRDSQGSLEIFKAEYNNIKEEIRAFATDDSLSSKKNILTDNILNAFTSTKASLHLEKQDKILLSKKDNELENRHITDKVSELKQKKSLLESGNQHTGEKGLLQINKEIEKNKLERSTIEQSFVIKKFWSVGTFLIAFLLLIFACYLSFFFASALYKMLFESDVYTTALEAGINPGIPKLVDADAIIKIFKHQGILFGFIASIFFLFPILLSNIKLLGSKNKFVNGLLFWVGLAIFDILVAGMIAINTDKINSLLIGNESKMQIWEVVKHGEFWMIFMFGMVPLIITHYLIENITNAYKLSERELVDAEKTKKIQLLDEGIIDLNSEKESINHRIKEIEGAINNQKNSILNLETHTNNLLNQIDSNYEELSRQLKTLFDDFNNKIISGKIFTDVILESVITAYNSGFIEHLPKFYATGEVARRVKEIEQIVTNN